MKTEELIVEPGNNDVGMETSIAPTALPEKHVPEIAAPKIAIDTADKAKRARCQGAMSQQGFGWHGNECYPQKLVQLVGHREPRTAPDAWDRLRKEHAADGAS
jgi:hypothetical protein